MYWMFVQFPPRSTAWLTDWHNFQVQGNFDSGRGGKVERGRKAIYNAIKKLPQFLLETNGATQEQCKRKNKTNQTELNK